MVSDVAIYKALEAFFAKTPLPSPNSGADHAAGSETFSPDSRGADSAGGRSDMPFGSASTIVVELLDPASSTSGAFHRPTGGTPTASDDEFSASRSIGEGYVPDWIRQMSPSHALVWLTGAILIIALLIGTLKSRRTLDAD